MPDSFGETLRKIREENDWTLEDMAKKLGTTKQVLSRYERGQRLPRISIAADFAKKLNVPLEVLAGESDWLNGVSPLHSEIVIPRSLIDRSEMSSEDIEMENLWSRASLPAKRAAIAVLKSMESEG